MGEFSGAHWAPADTIIQTIAPFGIVNTYGLFAVMTTSRQEIIIEGSNDGTTWLSYEFKFKPGETGGTAPARPDWHVVRVAGKLVRRRQVREELALHAGCAPTATLIHSFPPSPSSCASRAVDSPWPTSAPKYRAVAGRKCDVFYMPDSARVKPRATVYSPE